MWNKLKRINSEIKEKYSKVYPLLVFFVRGIGLVCIWYGFYSFFRNTEPFNTLYNKGIVALTNSWLYGAKAFYSLLGYESWIQFESHVIQLEGIGGVRLLRGCLGRNLIGLFVGFIIAYPGSIRTKLWYIPLGLVAIYIVNTLRIGMIGFALLFNPTAYYSYNEHDIFKYLVYAIIFLLWYIWIAKLSAPKKDKSNQQTMQATT